MASIKWRKFTKQKKILKGIKPLLLVAILLQQGVSTQAQSTTAGADTTDRAALRFSVEEALKLPVEASEPVVFTASRQAQRLSDAPATILIITAEEIRTRGYQTLLDVLGDLPEYKTEQYGTDNPCFNAVSTRGIYNQEKFLILMDGLRISSYTNEPAPLMSNIPIQGVKQIEIVTSAASALYGADALMGVINLISYTPEETKYARASLYAGRFNLLGGNFFVGQKFGQVGIRINSQVAYDGLPNFATHYPEVYPDINESHRTGVFQSSFGPMTAPQPVSPEISTPAYSYGVEAAVTYQNLTFSFYRGYTRLPSSITYAANNAVYNDDVSLAQAYMKGSASFSKTFNRLQNTTTVLFSQYDLLPESNFRNVYNGLNYGYKFGYSSTWFMEQQNAYQFSNRFSVSGGLSMQSSYALPKGDDLTTIVNPSDRLESIIVGTPFNADFFSTQYYNFGAYLQALFKPVQRVSITVGGRYDYNTRFNPVFNPRVGVSYNASSKTLIKLFYGSGFLAPPPFYELSHFGSFYTPDTGKTWASFFYQLPNPELNPIRLSSFEGAIRQKIGPLSLNLTVYYIRASDLLVPGSDAGNTNLYNGQHKGWPVDYIQVFINSGIQENIGGSFTARYDKAFNKKYRLSVTGAVAYLDGEEKDNDGKNPVEIPYISTMQYRGIIDFYAKKWTFSLRAIAMNTQRARFLAENTPGVENPTPRRNTIPGYYVLHANVGYQILKQLRCFVSLQNLTDRRYFNINESAFDGIQLNGQPQNPFRAIIGIDFLIK